MVNEALPGVVEMLMEQPPSFFLEGLLTISEGTSLLDSESDNYPILAARVAEIADACGVNAPDGVFTETDWFDTVSGMIGSVNCEMYQDLVKVLLCLSQRQPLLAAEVFETLSVTSPTSKPALAVRMLCGDQQAIDIVSGNAGMAWDVLVDAESYLNPRKWRKLAGILASTLGMNLLRDVPCNGLPPPRELLRPDNADIEEIGDICRVLAGICVTREAAEATWALLSLRADDLLACSEAESYSVSEGIIALCSAIARSGADIELPLELLDAGPSA